jgi:hypothetical protein
MLLRACWVRAGVDGSVFWAMAGIRDGGRKSAVKVQISLAGN